jgi:3-oxoadipate enol-lactonase
VSDLHFVQRGEGEPLLLIMGMSGTHLSWGDAFLDLLAEDFAVTAYDHRGVGRSPAQTGAFTLPDLAADVPPLLDHLGLESAHVMGISMGGMVAMHLALQHPERIRTLVLGCTYAGGPGQRLGTGPKVMALLQAMQSGDRERALRAGFEANVSEAFARDEAAYAAFRRAALELPVPVAAIMAQAAAIQQHDVHARLGEIAHPTLVVHGDQDHMLPVENGRDIAVHLPDARYEELAGIGHLFWVEAPERTARLVREHARAVRH